MTTTVSIDCPHCSTRVLANVLGLITDDEGGIDVIAFGRCPSCGGGLLGLTEWDQDNHGDYFLRHAQRLWPAPSSIAVSDSIPLRARKDIADAQKCMVHGIFSAAAVLCGRALERLVQDRAPSKTLADGLKALQAKGEIDDRLFEWANALRKERNLGAHASEHDTTREDAQDVLDFTVAIFEYVYTLREKYEAYKLRKAAHPTGSAP